MAIQLSGSLNLTGSLNNSGSLNLIGTSILSGSILMSGSRFFQGETLNLGNTTFSGSLNISGSRLFQGVSTTIGEQKITGSLYVTGSIYINGSVGNSGFYYNGNRQFNYAQFYNTETMSGSADTTYPMWYNNTEYSATSDNTIYVGDGSRIYVKNTGIYDIRFSAQLGTTATETCEFSIWFAITGSNVAHSNTDITINKTAGGGNIVAAWNFMSHLSSGSYFEIMYSKTTANGQVVAKSTQSSPNRPATPSIITSVSQVG